MTKANLFACMCFLATLPTVSMAAIPYRVEQVRMPTASVTDGHDSQAYARDYRFYVGGAYNFSMWSDYTDDNDIAVGGKNTSSFDITAGVRVSDTFRVEGNYINTRADWNAFSLTGHTAMINAIIDARMDSLYRLFRSQKIVPYVGVGGGLTWNSADDVQFQKKISPTAAALAGVSFELGPWFAVDFGYRYFYMFTPQFDTIHNMAPTAHQLRAGARVSF